MFAPAVFPSYVSHQPHTPLSTQQDIAYAYENFLGSLNTVYAPTSFQTESLDFTNTTSTTSTTTSTTSTTTPATSTTSEMSTPLPLLLSPPTAPTTALTNYHFDHLWHTIPNEDTTNGAILADTNPCRHKHK